MLINTFTVRYLSEPKWMGVTDSSSGTGVFGNRVFSHLSSGSWKAVTFSYASCVSWGTLVPGTQSKPGLLFWPLVPTCTHHNLNPLLRFWPCSSTLPLFSFILYSLHFFSNFSWLFLLMESHWYLRTSTFINIYYGMWNLLTNHFKRFQINLGPKMKLQKCLTMFMTFE